MGFLDLIQEILDPKVVSNYNYLKVNCKDALDNWLRGGYRPRCIIPKNEREPFDKYDQEWNYINSKTRQHGWIDLDAMTYEQKCFIVGRKQQIISLYSTFQKFEAIAKKVVQLASEYPFGFNAVAIKYGQFRVKNMYYEYDYKPFNSNWDNRLYISINDLSRLRAKEVESVYNINYEQGQAILTHMEELRSENQRLSKQDSEEKEIERQKKEKEVIEKALRIARWYSKEYKETLNYPLDSLTLSRAKQIIEKEACFKKRHEEELARQRKETEKRNLSTTLPSCVSSWTTHSYSTLKHKYFYDYYTYAIYKDNASTSMWETWRLVWHFKNDPARNISDYEHDSALQKVTNLVENELRLAFGSKTEYLTLVCITGASQRKTELRFKEFSEKVCKDLNMTNAFPHIRVVQDGESKHDGGDSTRTVSYDKDFFQGKYIVLFDDVRTSGRSLENERQRLESFGAKVICAITIAQTTH